MPKFDATINGISLASYGIEPNMATVPQPEAKTYQAEIPGRDGLLDYTDAYGVVRYENRTVTVEAYEIGDITARMEHRRAVCSDMHGKTCTLSLTTLPGYTFTGRCSVEYDEDGSETAYKLSFDCQPYMSAGERTFVGNCAGGVDLVFMSGDKPVKPRIEVPRHSIIIFNGQQYEVEAGTWTFDDIVFKRGRNELYINTYTEPGTTTWGDLESMTWEQIGWHHRQSEASGALVNVTDALQARPNKLGVDGKSVQDGTPTPDVPVEIDVVDSPVSVQATGKNLIPALGIARSTPTTGTTFTDSGITWTLNPDGSINVSGTATATTYCYINIGTTVITPGTYTRNSTLTGISVVGEPNINPATFTLSNAKLLRYAHVMVTAGTTTNMTVYPQLEVGSVATAYEPYKGNTYNITLPSDHNYLASLPNDTRDELVLRSDGVAVLVQNTNRFLLDGVTNGARCAYAELQSNSKYIAYFKKSDSTMKSNNTAYISNRPKATSLNNCAEVIGSMRLTTAGNWYIGVGEQASVADAIVAGNTLYSDNPTTVYYPITPTTRYSADNGATWSTTDHAAGTSSITLHEGTNNVWCTDALSPTITLNYDTQERTRKQRISELYWRNNPPQWWLTWGQLATHTWAEIGSKPVQEWYYSGTADVVENAYINYEIGDL